MSSEARLQRLLDQGEIRDVIYRYCRGIDRRQYDLVRSCYHPDAIDDHAGFRGNVDEFISYVAKGLPVYEGTMHFIGNVLIEPDGDQARAESYIVAHHRLAAREAKPERDYVVGLRYVDDFERRNGGHVPIRYRLSAGAPDPTPRSDDPTTAMSCSRRPSPSSFADLDLGRFDMPDQRLGAWQPATFEERFDRMESYASIQQLVARYGRALDARDMDTIAGLFSPNVQGSATAKGRAALRESMVSVMSRMRTSVHMVAQHVIDFHDADTASGIVYCRDELERIETGNWDVGTIQYWDDYERVDGEWCFLRRRLCRWYLVDALERPGHGKGVNQFTENLRERQLPDAYPTWQQFWEEVG
jgi:SnoaL-like domain